MKTKIIGIGHKARQGKGELSKYLAQFFTSQDIYVREYGFSDPLYHYCRVAYGMTQKDPKLLQLVGTDIFRNRVSINTWIDALFWMIGQQAPDVAIISDVRFVNEATTIRRQFGKLVHIQRLVEVDGVMQKFISNDRDPNHESETALDNYDQWNYRISAFDLEQLHTQAGNLGEDLLPWVMNA